MACGVPQGCCERYKWLLRLYFLPVCGLLGVLTVVFYRLLGVVHAVPPLALTALAVWAEIGLPAAYVDTLRYTRHADRLVIDRGVLWRQSVLIPRGQVQYAVLRRSLPEKLFRLCTLEAHTSGGVIRLCGLDLSEANRLRAALSSTAGSTAGSTDARSGGER